MYIFLLFSFLIAPRNLNHPPLESHPNPQPRNLSKAIVPNTCLSQAIGLFICSPVPMMDIRHIFWMNPSCIMCLILSPVFSPVTLSPWWDPSYLLTLVQPLLALLPAPGFPPAQPQECIAQSTPSAPAFLQLSCWWPSLSPEIKWVHFPFFVAL